MTEGSRVLEIGAAKWCKEHLPRNERDLIMVGKALLDNPDLWKDKRTLHWECLAFRPLKRERINGTFLLHHKGAITVT